MSLVSDEFLTFANSLLTTQDLLACLRTSRVSFVGRLGVNSLTDSMAQVNAS